MVKSLYSVAQGYVNLFNKTAHFTHSDDEELDEDESVFDELSPETLNRLEDERYFERKPLHNKHKHELGKGRFEDFDPELQEEDRDINAMYELEEEGEDPEKYAATSSPSVIKIARLYAKAKNENLFENIEDLPVDDEPEQLSSVLRDTGLEDPEEELERGEDTDETSELDFGDPGEYMPHADESDEDLEDEAREKAERLNLIKQRHQEFLRNKDKPKVEEKDPSEDISDLENLLDDDDDEEDDEDELSAFEDEE